jgi:predicted PurR-regulated permease PerM
VLGGLTSLLMIFVLGIFLAMEPRLYERGFAWLLPVRERSHFYAVTDAMGYTLRRLMAGRLLGMFVEGVATWILLGIYGIPMAALLGIITGLLVFIPNVGAIISGILMVLVGFSIGIEGGLYALAVYFIVQTIDGYVIVPMVAKRTVDLAPALVLGAQLLFGALFGIMGLALADPIVAMIKVALEKNAERTARRIDAETGDVDEANATAVEV